MYKFLLLAGLVGLTAGCQPAAESDAREVSTSGVAEVTASPDFAVLELGVEVTHADIEVARQQAEQAVDRLLEELDSGTYPVSDISSDRIISRPDRHYRDGEWLNRGYYVAREVRVTVRDLKAIGPIYDAATAAGMTSLAPPSYGLDDPRAPYREALAAAVQDARASAKRLADTLGHRLGDARVITENGGNMPITRGARAMNAEASAPPTDIRPDDMRYSASVSVRFELVD